MRWMLVWSSLLCVACHAQGEQSVDEGPESEPLAAAGADVDDAAAGGTWQEEVSGQIAASEYGIRADGQAFTAPNRA